MTIMTATAAESTAEFALHTVGDRPHHLYVYNDVGRFVGEIVRCEHPRDAPPWIAYDIRGERMSGEFPDPVDAARTVVRTTRDLPVRSAVRRVA
jgi:extradiol dioxygenase family protein